ncbi:hypothetical protein NLJ89_g9895 [Agrocybe chaxingu]|uniref:Uncharacterized protein n=1 Tax=Agrocybe chaxingu TaxID=84603 RepID=A0A9W8MRE4_9AGAR|nr:hypothetical protein NLJ89_g9895 [Agrocybe chaxingu]
MSSDSSSERELEFGQCLQHLLSESIAPTTDKLDLKLHWDMLKLGPIRKVPRDTPTVNDYSIVETYGRKKIRRVPDNISVFVLSHLTSLSLTGNDVFIVLPYIHPRYLDHLTITVKDTDRLTRREEDYVTLARFLGLYYFPPMVYSGSPLSTLQTLKIYDPVISEAQWPAFLSAVPVMYIPTVRIYFKNPARRVARYLKRWPKAFETLGGYSGPSFGVYWDRGEVAEDRRSYLGWNRIPGTLGPDPSFDSDMRLVYFPRTREVWLRGECGREASFIVSEDSETERLLGVGRM